MHVAAIPIYRKPEEELTITIDPDLARELRNLEEKTGLPTNVSVRVAIGRFLEDLAKGVPILPTEAEADDDAEDEDEDEDEDT